jgi:hypothetical protein
MHAERPARMGGPGIEAAYREIGTGPSAITRAPIG